jgi:hypothetical protein
MTYLAGLSSSAHDARGTLLITPTTPAEAIRLGQRLNSYLSKAQLSLFPSWCERTARKHLNNVLRSLTPEPCTTGQVRNSHSIETLRTTRDGKVHLAQREAFAAIRGYIYDDRATGSSWGFELQGVKAGKLVIFSVGMDQYTPLPGVRYMRKRLENCDLVTTPPEDNLILPRKYAGTLQWR